MISVAGQTYMMRDALKSAGGRWNPTTKAWEFEDDKLDLLKIVVVFKGPKGVRLYQDGKEVPLTAKHQMSLF